MDDGGISDSIEEMQRLETVIQDQRELLEEHARLMVQYTRRIRKLLKILDDNCECEDTSDRGPHQCQLCADRQVIGEL